MNSARILVIDDEAQIRKLLEITLQADGHAVLLASTAKEGIMTAAMHPPDLVILDLGLPDIDGQTVLKELRGWYTKPVIVLSARSNEEDIVQALDSGANDYLVKPFRSGELLARMRSAMRTLQVGDNSPILTAGLLSIDMAMRIVKKEDEQLKLTATEYTLLTLMAGNEGKVLTHQYLLKTVWGPGYVSQTQYLRVFIAQLRKKIEKDPNRPEYILTESGIGYRFVSPE